jgi:hypothetical protein
LVIRELGKIVSGDTFLGPRRELTGCWTEDTHTCTAVY